MLGMLEPALDAVADAHQAGEAQVDGRLEGVVVPRLGQGLPVQRHRVAGRSG